MAVVLYHTLAFLALFSYGLYHLISATLSLLKPLTPSPSSYSARPYHPLPTHRHHLLRHLPLYLSLLPLLLSILYYPLLSSSPLHLSLQHSFSLLLLALSLLSFSLIPNDLTFLLASLAFALLSAASAHSAASYNPSDLQSKCDSISSLVYAASAVLSLSLALLPRLFIADLALAASLCLRGLWSLQAGLSLYVEGFIPEGCHRLIDVHEASTRCDLEETRRRAYALLDLAFVLHTTFVAIVVVVVYVVVARSSGALIRRHNGGSYEALPTSLSSGTLPSLDHVQMKAITKNSMQAQQ